MTSDKRTIFLTRDGVMRLLADDEQKSVKSLQASTRLGPGEEYLDLEKLDQGALRGPNATTPMGNVLPKRALRPATWSKIVALIAATVPRSDP